MNNTDRILNLVIEAWESLGPDDCACDECIIERMKELLSLKARYG